VTAGSPVDLSSEIMLPLETTSPSTDPICVWLPLIVDVVVVKPLLLTTATFDETPFTVTLTRYTGLELDKFLSRTNRLAEMERFPLELRTFSTMEIAERLPRRGP